MKTYDIKKLIGQKGFRCIRAIKHEVWSNGSVQVYIPRHKDVSKHLAKQILKQCGVAVS